MGNKITPQLTVQTASLWSSGVNVFSGSGGPSGYDPFTGQFGAVISSAGLDTTPFQDTVWNIQAGDLVTFVIAVQNRGPASSYDTVLADTMPAGFDVPAGGTGLTVTDGVGNVLNTSGDLFGSAGLTLTDALAGYDPSSGANVALLTFDLQAATTVAVPSAQLTNSVAVLGYAASEGGPNLASSVNAAALQASTVLGTATYSVQVTPDQSVTALQSNQLAAFDVTVTLPLGETRDLKISEILPQTGTAWLQLSSVEITHVGAGLSASGLIAVQPDGSVSFGDVVAAPDSTDAAADSITLHVTVRSAGTTAGQGMLNVAVSAADPSLPAQRTTDTVSTALPLAAPDVPPTMIGLSANQCATNSASVLPFAKLSLADPDAGQILTLTIQLSDKLMGHFGSGSGTYNTSTGTYTITGTVDAVQQAARSLTFTTGAGRSGAEHFALTLDDGAGGVATTTDTLSVVAAAASAATIPHFALAGGKTISTSTADGTPTVSEVETYQGPVNYLQYQFIYDGAAPLAMAAQTPNIFIKNVAGSAAVKLLSGQNVVDAGHGSNFLVSGTGQDVFYLDTRQALPTWDTIVGFHSGDIATIWGFQDGVSRYSWDDSAGASGYTGRTLRLDIAGNGSTQESVTFAGTTAADTGHYAISTGSIGATSYMAIFAV